MKYSVETTEDGCLETLELNDSAVFTRKSHFEGSTFIQDGLDFNEQLEEAGYMNQRKLNMVYDLLDGFFANNFMEIQRWQE